MYDNFIENVKAENDKMMATQGSYDDFEAIVRKKKKKKKKKVLKRKKSVGEQQYNSMI